MFGGSKKSSTFALANEKQPLATYNSGALVQSVRISACHAGGHEFESRTHRTEQRKKEAFRLPFCVFYIIAIKKNLLILHTFQETAVSEFLSDEMIPLVSCYISRLIIF